MYLLNILIFYRDFQIAVDEDEVHQKHLFRDTRKRTIIFLIIRVDREGI